MANTTLKAATSKSAKPRAAAGVTESKPSSGARPNGSVGGSPVPMTSEARQAMIAEAAYYIAEQRGFGDGHDLEDWLLAEKQIDAALSA